jgi:hypothetical protein
MSETCSHHIIEDLIDMDPDRSKQIFYCTKCFATFCHKEYIQLSLYDNIEKPDDEEFKQENQQ